MYKRTCIISREIKHRRCRFVCIGDETEQLGRNEFLVLRNHIVHRSPGRWMFQNVSSIGRMVFQNGRWSAPG